MAFGRQVRAHRERLGITQDVLAEILGKKGQSYVSHIEHGRQNLTLDTMALLADALGFELEVVFRPRG